MADNKNETGVAKGFLLSPATIEGKLSNATLRGMAVVLQVSGTTLQWRYEDETEWRNLIDLNDIDYEALQNLPQINGVTLTGNKSLDDLDIASKHNGLANITRNGTTFTVTRADGTTFTFDQQDTTYVDATASASGLMSASDKEKMDNIEQGAQANVIESISINGDVQAIDEKNVNIVLPLIDDTLSVTGRPADAKATGDAISGLEEEIAKKQNTLPFATPTSEDIGKALMPKTIENGEVTEWEFGEAGMVDDVQINGTSIVENKVAVIKTNPSNGIMMLNGSLSINPAANGTIKNPWASASANYRPIVPTKQHLVTFYGLAAAAGDTTQYQSDNAVGQYTDEAKTAIKTMLGIDTAIADAVGEITSFDFQVVTALPSTGTKGVIYLVAHSHGSNDGYDEYIWINNAFEKLGHTDIDLTDYLQNDDISTDAQVDAMLQEIGIVE